MLQTFATGQVSADISVKRYVRRKRRKAGHPSFRRRASRQKDGVPIVKRAARRRSAKRFLFRGMLCGKCGGISPDTGDSEACLPIGEAGARSRNRSFCTLGRIEFGQTRHEKSLRYRPEAFFIRVGFQNKREYFLYALFICTCIVRSLLWL